MTRTSRGGFREGERRYTCIRFFRFMFFLSSFRKFDWRLMGGIAFLSAVSLVSLASFDLELFRRQALWYVLFFAVIFLGSQVPWRFLLGQAWFRHGFYFVSVFLLLVPILQSGAVRGAKSWIILGGARLQPSEFFKVGLIFALAGFFSRLHV